MTAREPSLPLTPSALREGLARVSWPGRAELIPTDPLVLLDGAHNAASGAVLRELLTDLFSRARIGLVLGMSRGKDVEGLCTALQPVVVCARGFLADLPGYGGGMLAEFSWILRRMGSDISITINPEQTPGFDLDPEMVAMVAALLPEEGQ